MKEVQRAGLERAADAHRRPGRVRKTTPLAQWAASDPRPFAWVSADELDNDPGALAPPAKITP